MRTTHPIAAAVTTLGLALTATGLSAQTSSGGSTTTTTTTERSTTDATGQQRSAGDSVKSGDRQAKAEWERRHRASKMIGTNVRDQAGERVGSIEDIVLDRQGNVTYAVVSAGGFLGLGEKLFAVPWKSLSTQPGQDHYVMNVNKDQMRQAQGFDKDNWPDLADTRWQDSNRGFYGTAPAGAQRSSPTMGQPPSGTSSTAPAGGSGSGTSQSGSQSR